MGSPSHKNTVILVTDHYIVSIMDIQNLPQIVFLSILVHTQPILKIFVFVFKHFGV